MIIKLIFDQSGGSGFAAFKTGVETAALMLEKAITNPITVTIEVGYGEFPTDHTAITGGAAEAEPNFDLVSSASFTNVVNHLSAGAAPGDTNFDTLTSIVMSGGTSITGSNGTSYNKVLLWSAEAKALGFPVSQGGVDGFAGFAKDINPNSLVGVALHELTHALGRAPYGLPAVNENDIPDIFDLFRFDSATNSPLVLDNGANAPPAYFTVNNGATISANYGETSDPSDFLNDSLTSGDPFDEFYDPSHPSSQSLTRLDLTQLDVLGFNTIAATFSWASGVNGDFASASNWTSGGESPPTSAPIFNDNVLITQGGVYTVSSFADQTINSLVMASGATLDIIGGVFTIENGTFFANTSGTIEVNAGATLVLDGEVDNAGTIEAVGGTIELLATLTGSGANLISSGGTLIVAFGGVSDPVTIFSGGTEIVDSGGTDGGAQISGGEQDVFGSANGAIVFAGSQVIEAGGTASNTIVLSGGMLVLSGTATLKQATISAGGVLTVGSGATLSSFAVNSGVLVEAASGGSAKNATVSAGGTLAVVAGGMATSAIVRNGGTEVVSAGGDDLAAKISGGTQFVYGEASNATIFTGSQVVEAGGTASATVVSGGTQRVFGLASGASILAGLELIELGGTASGTIEKGGTELVSAGGTDFAARISGGTQFVYGDARRDRLRRRAGRRARRHRERHDGVERRHV